jgi:hypothetical protein
MSARDEGLKPAVRRGERRFGLSGFWRLVRRWMRERRNGFDRRARVADQRKDGGME